MRDLIFLLLMVPTLSSIVLVGPQIGIIAWHVLSLMNPHRLLWGFGQTIPWAYLVAVITLGSWLLGASPKRPPLTRTMVLMFALVVWVSITTVTAIDVERSLAYWEQVMKIMLMAIVTVIVMSSRERLHALMWTAALSIGYYGAKGGLFSIVTGGQNRVYGPAQSFIEDNNNLALALVMTVPIMAYLARTAEKWWVRWGTIGVAGLTVIATLFTYSRGGAVGLAAMATLLLLRSRRPLLYIGLIGMLAVAAVPMIPDKLFERVGTIQTYEQDDSAMSRLAMWNMAIKIAVDHPITGGGFKVFLSPGVYPRYFPELDSPKDVHSSFFQMLGEHGFVGLAIFVALGLSTLADVLWVMRRTKKRPDLQWARHMALALGISLTGYAASALFLTLAFYDYLYLVIAIMIGLRAVVRRELAKEPAPQPNEAVAAPLPVRRRLRGSYWGPPPLAGGGGRGRQP